MPVEPKYKSYSPIKGRTEASESSESPKDEKLNQPVRLEILNATNYT